MLILCNRFICQVRKKFAHALSCLFGRILIDFRSFFRNYHLDSRHLLHMLIVCSLLRLCILCSHLIPSCLSYFVSLYHAHLYCAIYFISKNKWENESPTSFILDMSLIRIPGTSRAVQTAIHCLPFLCSIRGTSL